MLLTDAFRPLEFLLSLESHRQQVDHLRVDVWVHTYCGDQTTLLIFFVFEALHNSVDLLSGQLRHRADAQVATAQRL